MIGINDLRYFAPVVDRVLQRPGGVPQAHQEEHRAGITAATPAASFKSLRTTTAAAHCDVCGAPGDDADPADGRLAQREPRSPQGEDEDELETELIQLRIAIQGDV